MIYIRSIVFIFISIFITQINAILCMEENEAVVRIWNATGFGPWGNYGHTSLETKNYYMSFWPMDIKSSLRGNPQKGVLMINLSGDEKKEGNRTCDYNYVLSTEVLGSNFSVCKIEKEFESFLEFNEICWSNIINYKNIVVNKSKWHFNGSIVEECFYQYSNSCISFVINLLVQGGGGFENIPRLNNAALSAVPFGGIGPHTIILAENTPLDIASFQKFMERRTSKDNCIVS